MIKMSKIEVKTDIFYIKCLNFETGQSFETIMLKYEEKKCKIFDIKSKFLLGKMSQL